MKDKTYAARLERAVAALELILGRLEAVTVMPPGAVPGPQIESPRDVEAERLAEKVIQVQIEEQRELAAN